MLAKICGVKTLEAAKHAADNNADYIGVILVPNRKRTVDHDVAKAISTYLHELPSDRRPKLVGVFRNQSLEEIHNLKSTLRLDVVQLHGSEPISFVTEIEGPVIKRFAPGTPNFVTDIVKTSQIPNTIALVDSEQGGDGKTVDWSVLSDVADAGGVYILAGGLNPNNVKEALCQPGCIGVDVSGGVESPSGDKDFAAIEAFLNAVKS